MITKEEFKSRIRLQFIDNDSPIQSLVYDSYNANYVEWAQLLCSEFNTTVIIESVGYEGYFRISFQDVSEKEKLPQFICDISKLNSLDEVYLVETVILRPGEIVFTYELYNLTHQDYVFKKDFIHEVFIPEVTLDLEYGIAYPRKEIKIIKDYIERSIEGTKYINFCTSSNFFQELNSYLIKSGVDHQQYQYVMNAFLSYRVGDGFVTILNKLQRYLISKR